MREFDVLRAFLYYKIISKGLDAYLSSRCLTGELEKYLEGLDILIIKNIIRKVKIYWL